MRLIVDKMPYFMGDCPFYDDYAMCTLDHCECEHFDPPCRERNLESCRMLITLEAYENEKKEEATT